MTSIPKSGTQEYDWWSAGAHAEARARTDGRSKAGLEVRKCVDVLAEHQHDMDERAIVTLVFSIYGLAGRTLGERLRIALWALRGGRGRPPC